ncbi:MAG TPA: DUF4386 domain-containing protein [Kofleriaceae bacterium]|nr:DUF4386 domain-containing protein [Kofleriaceae bacterium]
MSATVHARTAGVLYLVIAVLSAFAIAYVPSVIVVDGDATATAANLMAHRGLFGMSVVANVIVMLTEIVLSVMLFAIFKPVSRTLSLIALVSRLTIVVVMAVELLIYIMPMVLHGDARVTLALFEAHRYGIYVWDMFFGFHLAVLGCLVLRSGYFPRPLGFALVLGSAGYFFKGLSEVTFVESAEVAMVVTGLLVVATIAELTFALWLLIRRGR